MLPIFGSADPIALTETSSYRFFGFLLMRTNEDKIFVDDINAQYKKWHQDTGNQFVICTFQPPPKVWMERYANWWINNYSSVDCKDDINALSDILKDRNYKIDKIFFNDFSSITEDLFNQSLIQQKNIANIFDLTDNDLPAFIILDKYNHNLAVIRIVDAFHVSCIIGEIVDKNSLPKKYCIPLSHEEETILLNAISHSSENFHHSFAEASLLLVERRITEEKIQSDIADLIKKFPQFVHLNNPQKFSWAKSLLKGLDRHRSLVDSYIKQINLLENESNHPSLDLKTIQNPKIPTAGIVWRFRINEKYRAWFFEKNNERIHFFLGGHDYGIR